MSIKKCPKCGNMEFYVTAHVCQDWKVSADGSWLETVKDCSQVAHQPDDEDLWECTVCGHEDVGRKFNVPKEREDWYRSRSHIESTLASLKAKAEELGLTLECDPEFFQDDDHLDCVWYGGWFATLRDEEGNSLEFCISGEVRIYGSEDEDEDWCYVNKFGDGALAMNASDALRERFASDAELREALKKEEIRYENNNWIEVFFKSKDAGDVDPDAIVGDSNDVLEELSDLSGWAEALQKYIKGVK